MSILSLDPSNLARQYTQIERAARDQLYTRNYNSFDRQIKAINTFQSALRMFLGDMQQWKRDGVLANTATVSNTSAVSVTADSTAVAGSYDIFVQQRAQAHQLALSFDPEAQLAVDGEFSIAVAGQEFSVDMSTLPAEATVADLARAINDQADNTGVKATLLRSGTETFLVIAANDTGAANELALNFTPGIDPAGAQITDAINAAQTLSIAQDAIVQFGTDSAISISSASNTLDSIVEGVSIDLLQVQAAGDSPVRIQIGADNSVVSEKLGEFVTAYNELMGIIGKEDSLKKDVMIRGIQNQFRNAIQQPVGDNTFFSIGLEFDRNGKLTVNTSKLEKALAEDSSAVETMLSGAGGLFSRLEPLDTYTTSRGLMAGKLQNLQASLDMVSAKRKRHDHAMDMLYQRYVKQFTQMQRTVAQLEASMSNFNMT